ncbi:MAG: GMC family oxidoreductase N-terminal domain-containing protein [Thiolinea sp.]
MNSPQLLQLSGIGDPALLQKLGLQVLQANPPVGRHLQDHLCLTHTYRSRVPTLNNAAVPAVRQAACRN